MAEIPAPQELAALYRSWETAELAQAIGAEAGTYSPEALALMRQELERRGERPDELAAAAAVGRLEQEADKATARAAHRERLRGVRGFLALMVFDIGVRSLWWLYWMVPLLRGRPPRTIILMTALSGVMGLYGLFICLLLLRRQPRAPREAAAWYVFVLAIGAVAAREFWRSGRLGWPLLCVLSYPVLWLLYLWKSRRVAVTFGPPPPPAPPDLAVFD